MGYNYITSTHWKLGEGHFFLVHILFLCLSRDIDTVYQLEEQRKSR